MKHSSTRTFSIIFWHGLGEEDEGGGGERGKEGEKKGRRGRRRRGGGREGIRMMIGRQENPGMKLIS